MIDETDLRAQLNNAFGEDLTEDMIVAAVPAAIRYYSRYNPRVVRSTLSLTVDDSVYDLPSDFIALLWFEWWPEGEPTSRSPRSDELWDEMYTMLVDTAKSSRRSPYIQVSGGQLVLDVDPTEDEDVDYAYYGLQTLETIPDVDMDILVKLAIAEVLLKRSPEFSIAPNVTEGLSAFQFHRIPMSAAQAASVLRQEVKARYGGY